MSSYVSENDALSNVDFGSQNNETKVEDKTGILSRIGASRIARNLAMVAGLTVGGAGVFSLPGCGSEVQANIVKEAKFSTLGNSEKIKVADIDGYIISRTNLRDQLGAARTVVDRKVRQIEEAPENVSVKSLPGDLSGATEGAKNALNDETFKAVNYQLERLSNDLDRAVKLDKGEFSAGINSVGYQHLSKLQEGLHDWDTALERDLQQLNRGITVKVIAELDGKLMVAEQSMRDFVGKADSVNWVKQNQSSAQSVEKDVQAAKEALSQSESQRVFTNLAEDLRDGSKAMGDVLTTLKPEKAEEFWKPENSGKAGSSGKALMTEAIALIAALRCDFHQEVTKSLGAEKGENTEKNGGGGAANGGVTQVHHHNSNGFLTYYLLMNHLNSGSSLSYTPGRQYSYSGSERLRNSQEYKSYNETSRDSAGYMGGGRAGISAHPKAGSGRSVYVAPHGNSGGSKSAGSPGFGAGRSAGGGGFGG